MQRINNAYKNPLERKVTSKVYNILINNFENTLGSFNCQRVELQLILLSTVARKRMVHFGEEGASMRWPFQESVIFNIWKALRLFDDIS